MSRMRNIEIINDTLKSCARGSYSFSGRTIKLKLSQSEMQDCQALLPNEVDKACAFTDPANRVFSFGSRCYCTCFNMDTFTFVQTFYKDSDLIKDKNNKGVLVLNLANPVHVGGGVLKGSKAQEEDLCRRSTLLTSLQSEKAARYYEYNRGLNTFMGSDGMILTPKVEVFKDEDGNTLEDSFFVSVLTCTAPSLSHGMEGLSQKEYEEMLYKRIMKILQCAAFWGYEYLVLGAFGCGAFQNDANLVSDLFYDAMKDFRFNERGLESCFRQIHFAVLSRGEEMYNYEEFFRNFGDGNFYSEEDAAERREAEEQILENVKKLDQICGCLFGGAVGDALGYPVEFDQEDQIFYKYGESGIRNYELDPESGKALISDDTQMSLFTANGILVGDTRGCMRGVMGAPRHYVCGSYLDWLTTQSFSYDLVDREKIQPSRSWLLDVPELYSSRAPGITCMTALQELKETEEFIDDYVASPRNNSKGCGGIMRVAPLAIYYGNRPKLDDVDEEGAQLAAITHSHSLGYLPAAVLVHILSRLIYGDDRRLDDYEDPEDPVNPKDVQEAASEKAGSKDAATDAPGADGSTAKTDDLKSADPEAEGADLKGTMTDAPGADGSTAKTDDLKIIIKEAMDTVSAIEAFKDDEHLAELQKIVDLAIELSGNNDSDLKNIHKLGEGWVAEETLAIAIYCALKYQDDFEAGVACAVNHNGDSDSTGAVTGNILGARLGYKAIPGKFKYDLELAEVILEMADDLCHQCQMSEYSHYNDPEWASKYMYMQWPKRPVKPLFFWLDDGENGWLSNWYESPFIIDNFQYRWVEQYMMSQKAILFGDAVANTKILRANSPAECKKYGREAGPFNKKAWEENKIQIVYDGCKAKFEQNADLKKKLLATGDSIMAEASPRDKVWGIGLDARKAENVHPDDWPGENLLGRILMTLRDEFRQEDASITNGEANIGDIVNSPEFDIMNRMLRDGMIV